MKQALAKFVKTAGTTLTLLMLLSGVCVAASFDCSKASTRAEKTICSNPELSAMDERLNQVFQKAVKEPSVNAKELQQAEQRWISKERDRCIDTACFAAAYRKRTAQLEAMLAKSKEVMKIIIDTPKSGWRNSYGEQVIYTQSVNYPASSVETQEEQSLSAVIEGRVLGSAPDFTGPFKLIVNGLAMPLRVDHGAFSRPYSFSTGSNNVEIRGPDGSSAARVQFYEAYAEKVRPKVRILLSWDTDHSDLDLHVVTPDGGHCFYGERVLENGGALDVDVTTGYGPEIFATPAAIDGTYLIFVNYYGSGSDDDLTVATVSVVLNENTPDEKIQTFTVPMRKPGELVLVNEFVYP
jgi:uncharacterized protein YfaP (DUF2135 family)